MERYLTKRPSYDLIHGDSTEPNIIKNQSVNLTVTSPPYNVGLHYNSTDDGESYAQYLEFTKQWLTNVYDWTCHTGRLCLNIPIDKNKNGKQPVYADITNIATRHTGWRYHTTILWNESNISKRTAWGSWCSASAPHVIAPIEIILVLYKDEWHRYRRGTSTITKNEFINYTNGLWTFNGARQNGHPAPFPQELPDRCIKLFSFKEDVVLDPFAGSGTTIISALKNGRRAIGIEKSKLYHTLAKKYIDGTANQTEFSL